jgi:molybdopterin synthase sulfur carrier subunit
VKILYFSWLREFIGVSSEEIETNCKTVMELIGELSDSDKRYNLAFSDLSVVRVAVDQNMVDTFEANIVGAKEVAFFPPMTGG